MFQGVSMVIVRKRTFFLPAWAKMSGDVVLGMELFNKKLLFCVLFRFLFTYNRRRTWILTINLCS